MFEPTRSALVPRLVAPRELVTASTVSTVTWSVMAAAGGVVGGTVLSFVGVRGAFVLDALTFLGSAALTAAIPPATAAAPGRKEPAVGRGFRDGLAYLAGHKVTGVTLLVKGINRIAAVEAFLVI